MATANIRAASAQEKIAIVAKGVRLIEKRSAPSRTYPHRVVDWPAPQLGARVFVGGIQLLDVEHGSDQASVVDHFLTARSPSGVAVWALGTEAGGVFVAQPPMDLVRNWILTDLILSPSVILSIDSELLLITDEQMRFSVLGASKADLAELDQRLGGTANYCKILTQHIQNGEIGFGAEDIDWAKQFLHAWCYDSSSRQ